MLDVTWRYRGQLVPLGSSGDTLVQRIALVQGRGVGGVPDLEARFEVRDGVPECVELCLRAQKDGRAIRSADLRLFDIDGLTFNVFLKQAMRRPSPGAPPAFVGDERSRWAAWKDIEESQAGRSTVSRRELDEVARIYRENVGGKPVEAVRVGLGYGSHRTAARRVEQARAAGLLPPTSRGKKKA